VQVLGPGGRRVIPFEDFPAGYLTPSIDADEIVTALQIPLWPAGHKAAFVEFARRHGDFAIASAAVLLEIEATNIVRASVVVGGVAIAPIRMEAIESAIAGHRPDLELFAQACEACHSIEALSDVHASADYRRHIGSVMVRRALERASGLAAAVH
jgi:carbon-monoxide dehydrogenase medium subunit